MAYDDQLTNTDANTDLRESNKLSNPSKPSVEHSTGSDANKLSNHGNRALGAAALEKSEESPDSGGLSTGFGTKGSAEMQSLSEIGKRATGTRAGGLKRFKSLFWSTPLRKGLSVAGLGGGTAGLIIGAALFVMPMLKIPSAISTIENKFFASSRQIGDTVTERLFTQYIIQKLIPGMITNRCESSRIDRNCAHPGNAKTYVGKLYNAWRDAKLEKKLYDLYGFEVVQINGRWFMMANGIDRVDLGEFDGSEEQRPGFERGALLAFSRSGGHRAFSYLKEVSGMEGRHGRQAGAYMSRKQGIPRTLLTARAKDLKDVHITDRLNAGKALINERIVGLYSESLALAMNCAMDRNFACLDPEVDDDGFQRTKFHNELRASAQKYSETYGRQKYEDMIAESKSIQEKGLAAHYVEKLVGEVAGTAGKATVRVAGAAIPVIGWIDLGAVLGTALDKAPEMYPAIVYGVNSQQMVAAFGTYAVAGDEFKSGGVLAANNNPLTETAYAAEGDSQSPDIDLAVYGSLAQTLDATDTANGFYGAEASPAFASSNGKQVDQSVRCNDNGTYGEPVEGILCPEESLEPSSAEWLAMGDVGVSLLLGPAFPYVAGFWNATAGWLFDQAGNFVGWLAEGALGLIPGYDQMLEQAGAIMGQVWTSFKDRVVPPLMTADTSGDRNLNTITGGGAIVAQDMCESMGCHAVSTEEYVTATTTQLQKEQEEFNQRSVFARLFDIDEPNSLVTKVALSTPVSGEGWLSTTASFFTNPFRTISSSLSSTNTAYAAGGTVGAYIDALHLKPQGIGEDERVMTCDDCEAFNAELNCDDPNDPNRMKWWAGTAKRDWSDAWSPEDLTRDIATGSFGGTSQYYYTETNPCLTFQSAACSAGGTFNEELCDIKFGGSGDTSSGPPAAGDGSFGTSTDMQALAQQVLANQRITLASNNDNPRQQMVNLANGTNTAKCNISPNVLNLILYIAQNHTIYISSINRFCADIRTASGDLSFHWKDGGGHAVDIAIVDGTASTGGTAKDLALLREIAPMIPSGGQLGQIQCRPAGSITTPPGVLQFTDSCNHIHISMPVYAY